MPDGTVQMLVFTDGRGECLVRTLDSFEKHLHGERVVTIINDEPGQMYVNFLRRTYAGTYKIINHFTRQGFGGAVRSGWNSIDPKASYVFHLEDDFVLEEDVEIADLISILKANPDVAQVALKRQPWNPEERAAGGIVELHPEDFHERATEWGPITLHRRFFTTNPSLYRAELTRREWPGIQHSEGIFTHQLLEDPALHFAFLGGKFDPPKVTHVGNERVGTGY